MTEELNAIRRELPEPEEGKNPWPYAVWLFFGIMIGWGATYMSFEAGLGQVDGGDQRTIEVPGLANEAPSVDGKTVFNNVCSACHQATGLGIPGAFPPLVGSEWVLGDPLVIAKVVLKGLQGPITVKGEAYAGVMPAFETQLKDEEIAAVANYIRGEWGNSTDGTKHKLLDKETVGKLREEVKLKVDSYSAKDFNLEK